MRLTSIAILALLPASLQAQNFTGSWSIPAGNVNVTLNLRQDRQGGITGTLNGQTNFNIQARVNGQMFEGMASNQSGRLYIAGQLQDANSMQVVMAEVDAAGNAQQQTARSFVATRGAGGVAASPGGKPGAGGQEPGVGAPQMGNQPNRGSGAIVGNGPQDQQLAQLLTPSAWCYFSYVSGGGSSGRSSTERVVFRQDGTGSQTTGGESYYSGSNGSVYNNQGPGGQQFRWRVQNGALLVSSDGVQWGNPVYLRVTQNSNGYPIITAENKEYSMCN